MTELLSESQLREQDFRLYGEGEAIARATQRQREEIDRQLHAPWPVLYQWVGDDGLVHHGNSVGEGATQEEAERKFFRQHPHVQPLAPSQKPESPTRNVENQAIPASGRNLKDVNSFLNP